jgi:hypothetical protein
MSQTQVQRLFIADKTSLMVDLFRVTSSYATSGTDSEDFLTSNWAQCNSDGFGTASGQGTGMTQSSGVFTFPTTGVYRVTFHTMGYGGNGVDNRYVGAAIFSTLNNSSYDIASLTYGSVTETLNDNTFTNMHVTHIFDCTDTTTHKVKFQVRSSHVITFSGASVANYTYATFERISDT